LTEEQIICTQVPTFFYYTHIKKHSHLKMTTKSKSLQVILKKNQNYL